MKPNDPKDDLHRYLKAAREAVVWKLEGLSEYDIRRPLTPTGTNLLGLVKHLASVEFGYFGPTFDRPHHESLPWWDDDAEPNADMWATADESREEILGLYRRACAHADATIEALPLDTMGHVAWWGDKGDATLQRIMLHMTAEASRHAGHADIVRELIDGSTGMRPSNSNVDGGDAAWYQEYWNRLESVAKEARAAPDRDAGGDE
ncbi:DinB family protein [Streptacidiphilus sp. P02-A3a]|uniref:DinB family protein n=1 Tax=Streptacidiphilus sp. P02-A3a TaxID=2704468 RepID=UPI0015FD0008|nr:DinB family protein [Streptacidiphilus sp. P02-A3a]QMU70565.1 DinB family protein [Streptacidiphilus sp. P02-A3a]